MEKKEIVKSKENDDTEVMLRTFYNTYRAEGADLTRGYSFGIEQILSNARQLA